MSAVRWLTGVNRTWRGQPHSVTNEGSTHLGQDAAGVVKMTTRSGRISGPPVVAVVSRHIGSLDNPKESRAPCAIAKDLA